MTNTLTLSQCNKGKKKPSIFRPSEVVLCFCVILQNICFCDTKMSQNCFRFLALTSTALLHNSLTLCIYKNDRFKSYFPTYLQTPCPAFLVTGVTLNIQHTQPESQNIKNYTKINYMLPFPIRCMQPSVCYNYENTSK